MHLFQVLNVEKIMNATSPWELLVLSFSVFIETGALPIGVLFPGDSLLFSIGILIATHKIEIALWAVYLTIFLATFFGAITGYYLGYKSGPKLFNKPDSLVFNRKNIVAARRFYEKYGVIAVLLGRFIPFVRTFNPMFAGASKMNFAKFVTWNFIGAAIWCFWMPSLGVLVVKEPYLKIHVTILLTVIAVVGITGVVYRIYKVIKKNLGIKAMP
ncbi:MAG: DedA family protein [Micrococcaceae bacterium]